MAALYSYPPTPYAIGLAILIAFIEKEVIETSEQLEEFLEQLLFAQVVHPDVTLSDLLHHESLEDQAKVFAEWLQVATQSIDAFIDLLSSVTTTNLKSRADVFRRRVGINCERLSMTEVVVLYNRFCREIKEATYNTKKPTSNNDNKLDQLVLEFDNVISCLQARDRVGAIHSLHSTVDHSLHALTAAGEFQKLIFSTFGESAVEAQCEAIRAAQKQGEHRRSTGNEQHQVATGNESLLNRSNHRKPREDDSDPEMAMLRSQLNAQQDEEGLSLEDRHILARKKLMGRYNFGKLDYDIVYYEALRTMLSENDKHVVPFEYIGFFLHEWAVRRKDWVSAKAWMSAIECHLHPRLDSAIFADFISQKAFSLSRQGKWKEAVRTIEGYLEQKQADNSINDSLWDRMCIQLGQIQLDAKQYTAAQASLLQCRPCAASVALLAILHLEFYEDPVKARGFAETALPKLMLHEHIFLQGQTMLTIARCTGSLTMYEKSLECFRAIQDVDALRIANFHFAHECHAKQEFEKRDQAAAAALALQATVDSSTPLPNLEELQIFIEMFAASGREKL